MHAEFVSSACPCDCPSACAMAVERLSHDHIDKVRGVPASIHTGAVLSGVASPTHEHHVTFHPYPPLP